MASHSHRKKLCAHAAQVISMLWTTWGMCLLPLSNCKGHPGRSIKTNAILQHIEDGCLCHARIFKPTTLCMRHIEAFNFFAKYVTTPPLLGHKRL